MESIDLNEVIRHCNLLVNGDQNAIITFQTFDDRKGENITKNSRLVRVFHCSIKWLEAVLTKDVVPLVQQGAGLFVMVNQGDGSGRKAKNVKKIRAVFIDLDKNGVASLEKIKLSQDVPIPHLIVETSPGKFHVYWLVDEMKLNDFKLVQKELSRLFDGDPSVTDLPRVLRVAGSLHQKGDPFRVKIVSENLSQPYPATHFTRLLHEPTVTTPSFPSDSSLEYFFAELRSNRIPDSQIREMLQHIDQADNYERWITVGLALFMLGDRGLDLWLEWSATAANFDGEACRSKWLSFGRYVGEKVTIGTIFYLAKEGGWVAKGTFESLTDAGNAQRLVRNFGLNIRYCPEYKSWMVWNGCRWVLDTDGELVRLAIESVRKIAKEVQDIDDTEIRNRYLNWAKKSESKQKIDAAIVLAQSVEGIIIHPAEMDQNPLLLNVKNGTIDLKTGELKSHSRSDYITNLVDIDYPQSIAVSLAWHHFLSEIFDGDTELIDYVQRVVGYCLTGEISEQCLFFAHGNGANGKSTFINVLSLLLESYATQTASETFMAKQNTGGATPELAVLDGKRMVTANETEEGQYLAEATIKQLCGGDAITARKLYCPPFVFYPKFKILIIGNYKPQIKGGDYGIWRRIHLIPFNVTFRPEQQSKDLPEKLKAELSAILQWAVDGCLKWQQQGLAAPEIVLSAVEEYREDMDTIGQWLDDCCSFGPGFITKSSKLYSSYKSWTISAGHSPLSQKRLGEALRMRGLVNRKVSGARSWQGIAIKWFEGIPPQVGTHNGEQ